MNRDLTLVRLLRERGERSPDRVGYRFHRGDARGIGELTYAELDRRARAIGAHLRDRYPPGERAVIACAPGADFLAAFFGCLYGSLIAVPAYPPDPARRDRTVPRFRRVLADASPRVILSDALIMRALDVLGDALDMVKVDRLDVSEISDDAAESWREQPHSADDIAFLQYTSGSTSDARGVVLRHGNVVHNLGLINSLFGHGPESHAMIWLPPYHDMGLIGGLLAPLGAGFPVTLLPTPLFVQRPRVWLEICSEVGATTTGGPTFAFEMVLSRVSPDDLAGLDLGCLEVTFCGAEPLRASVLEQFAELLAPCGFRRESLFSCYGLAEATLIVSGATKGEGPVSRAVCADRLSRGEIVESGERGAKRLVSSGRVPAGMDVRIVEPGEGSLLPDDRVGEVWLRGPSLTSGYWREIEDGLFADLPGESLGPFLRTGDLGFLSSGELFVTGRSKDLLIIRGRNVYPQDVEATVQQCVAGLRRGCGAAFAVDVDSEERLVVVQEASAERVRDLEAIHLRVRAAIAREHGVRLQELVLIHPRSLPKTSSGKVQRSMCRTLYLRDELDPIATWRAPEATDFDDGGVLADASEDRIAEWLGAWVGALAGVPGGDVDPDASLVELGLDSVDAITLSGELSLRLGRDVEPTVLYAHPTIRALAAALCGASPVHRVARREAIAIGDPIAIVGMAGRFAGARDVDELWALLCAGASAIGPVPAVRAGSFAHLAADREHLRLGGFLDRVDTFDAPFFGVSPREAPWIDPQQRILLEETWRALEDAGIPPDRLRGTRTGVFVGISGSDYAALVHARADGAGLAAHAGTGNAHSIAANRISHFLDLRGPSIAVDTACSSSLVALHLACQSLRTGECDAAIVAGVNVILSASVGTAFADAGMLSRRGQCRVFDAEADGYVRGEGCGVLVLERGAQAREHGDRVLGLVRGSAVNQDGRTSGLTVPSGEAQRAVLREALSEARVCAEAVSFVEAHGTGTVLGDPIELGALADVVGVGRERACWIGSLKANIGHLESAAGIAGLIKVLLCLQHGRIPPQVGFEMPNPYGPPAGSGLRVPQACVPWEVGEQGRIAGVSSFSFGGTNAHVVVSAPDTSHASVIGPERGAAPLVLSARSEEALREVVDGVVSHLASRAHDVDLATFCERMGAERAHFPHRLAATGSTVTEVRTALEAWRADQSADSVRVGRVAHDLPRVAFLYGGPDAFPERLSAALFRSDAVFREAIRRCAEIAAAALERSAGAVIRDLLGAGRADGSVYSNLSRLAFQHALTRVWVERGIQPAVVLGQSGGAHAAACAASALSLHDAIEIAVAIDRGRHGATSGGMVSVLVGPDRIQEILDAGPPGVSIAWQAGPRQLVFSGPSPALDEFVGRLAAAGVACRPLDTDRALHTPHMDGIAREVAARIGARVSDPLATLWISDVSGQTCTSAPCSDYWRDHLTRPLDLVGAVSELDRLQCDVILNIGPGAQWMHDARRASSRPGIEWLPGVTSGANAEATVQTMLQALYVRGAELRFERSGRRAPLPRYPLRPSVHWLPPTASAPRPDPGRTTLGLTTRHRDTDGLAIFEVDLSAPGAAFMQEHRIRGVAILPAAAGVSFALEAAHRCGAGSTLVDVELGRFAHLEESGKQQTLRVVVSTDGDGAWVRLVGEAAGASEGDPQIRFLAGRIARQSSEDVDALDLDQLDAECGTELSHDAFYAAFADRGVDYGPSFRVVERVRIAVDSAVGWIRMPEAGVPLSSHGVIHPALLDGCFQLAGALLAGGIAAAPDRRIVPVQAEHLWFGDVRDVRVCHVVRSFDDLGGAPAVTCVLRSTAGAVVGLVEGLRFRDVGRTLDAVERPRRFAVEWVEGGLDPLEPCADGRESARDWLVLLDRGGVGRSVASYLEMHGHRVCVVPSADVLTDGAPSEGATRSIEAVLKRWKPEARPDCPLSVLYLGALDPADASGGASSEFEALDVHAPHGPGRLAMLLRALLRTGRELRTFWLVTRGAHSDSRCDASALMQASLWAIVRTLALEAPSVRCGGLDLDPVADGSDAERVFREVSTGQAAQVRYSGERRLVPRWTSLGAPAIDRPVEVRPDGCYAVTGATGALGMHLLRWLASRGARHLIAIVRSAETAAVRGRIDEIRALGVTVDVRIADVAEREQLRRALVPVDGVPLLGVIHAAGQLQDGLIRNLDLGAIRETFRGKALGAWNLDQCTREQSLDFFVLFSSIASVLGSPGQAAYSAANAFLDALAHRRKCEGLPGLAVSFGPWSGPGMADSREAREALRRLGIQSIAPEAALEALGATLTHDARVRPHVVVVDARWRELAARVARYGVGQPAADLIEVATLDARSIVDEPPETSRESLQKLGDLVRSEVAAVLGYELHEVDADESLDNLGMDSLLAVDLRDRLAETTGVELGMTELVADPTSLDVARILHRRMTARAPSSSGAAIESGAAAPVRGAST